MASRDVESIRSRAKFVAALRRVADAIENHEPVRIQVASKRFVVPATARFSIEHEAEGADEELELQLKWRNDAAAPQPSAAGARRSKAKPRTKANAR